jgi:DNA-binding NtrC family response regulator
VSTFLIVDPDQDLRADVGNFFRSTGHSMFEASDLPAALALLSEHDCDVLVSAVATPGGSVRELVRAARHKDPLMEVIVLADLATTGEGIEAVHGGAFAMVQKPFSIPELNFHIKRALAKRGRNVPPAGLEQLSQEAYQPYNFIGESPGIKRVFRMVERIARTDSSVLITGETGTGKELVAGAIHYNSHRSTGPFVRVNCAAIPEQLLESELFGHEKGAFTGADKTRIGRFEHANGGTIFLDEVADMSLLTQAKVLRVIQEKEFERLGSNESLKTDVRIISATNKDLSTLMGQSLFREDLYYRLNVVAIRLPPLRERLDDIPLLVRFFLGKASRELKKGPKEIVPEALAVLCRYRWPGNIRELENTLERCVLLAEGDTITREDVSFLFPEEAAPLLPDGLLLPPEGVRLKDAERHLIMQALRRCGWIQKEAAELLGVSRRVLNYKIQRFGITHAGWKQNR